MDNFLEADESNLNSETVGVAEGLLGAAGGLAGLQTISKVFDIKIMGKGLYPAAGVCAAVAGIVAVQSHRKR